MESRGSLLLWGGATVLPLLHERHSPANVSCQSPFSPSHHRQSARKAREPMHWPRRLHFRPRFVTYLTDITRGAPASPAASALSSRAIPHVTQP